MASCAWLAVIAVGIAACSDRRVPADAHAAPAPPAAAPAGAAARPTVRWSHVQRTDGCFFFSGPEGRDDQVLGDVVIATAERQGDQLSLRIGTAIYDGTYAGGVLALTRTSTHDYRGAWTSTETIRGASANATIVAHYHYEECERAAAPSRCPGPCTIDAELTFAQPF